MPEMKKEHDKSVEIEAGGLSGRPALSLRYPWPRQTSTVSSVPQAFTRLRHRVLVVPRVEYAAGHQHEWVGQFNGDGYRCACGAVTSGKRLANGG